MRNALLRQVAVGGEEFFQGEAENGFVFQIGFDEADAFVGKAVNDQSLWFGQQLPQESPTDLLRRHANIGFVFDRLP